MIFITGASGYIGRQFIKNTTSNIRIVQRQSSPFKVNTNHDTFTIPSFSNDTDWTGAFEGIDTVLHLAAVVHNNLPDDCEPKSYYNLVNNEATLNLAYSAAHAGVRRFIFLSSVGVNGTSSVGPLCENSSFNPSDFYSISKMKAEQGLLQLTKYSNMEVVIIRPPMVYGPGAPGNFQRLIKLLKLNLPLPFGSINNTRSFVGIQNLIDFIHTCITHKHAANEVFLVSDDQDISLPELLRLIGLSMRKKVINLPFPYFMLKSIFFLLNKNNDFVKLTSSLKISIKKAKIKLNWLPKYTIQQELNIM